MPSATVNDFFIALTSDKSSNENIEKIYYGLSNFVEVFDKDKSIRLCLINDVYPQSVKIDLISQIVLDCDKTRKFLEAIVEFNLLTEFIDSRDFFLKKLRKILGRVRIDVTTTNLNQEEKLNLIKSSLEEIWGSNLEISFKEDQEILGGIILQVEDKFFDGSLIGRINELKKINLKGEFNV